MTEEVKKVEATADELKAEAIKYRQARNEARIEAAVLKECIKYGITDYDAATKLLPTTDLEMEDGKIKGLDKAFETMLKDRPYLNPKNINKDDKGKEDSTQELKSIIKQSSAKPQSSGTEKYTREDVKNMSAEQINANWETISKQLEAKNL